MSFNSEKLSDSTSNSNRTLVTDSQDSSGPDQRVPSSGDLRGNDNNANAPVISRTAERTTVTVDRKGIEDGDCFTPRELLALTHQDLIELLLKAQKKIKTLEEVESVQGKLSIQGLAQNDKETYDIKNKNESTTPPETSTLCKSNLEVELATDSSPRSDDAEPIKCNSKDVSETPQEDDLSKVDSETEIALTPSPIVQTPPYEYIFLPRGSEGKYRIYMNPLCDALFQAELAQICYKSNSTDAHSSSGSNNNVTLQSRSKTYLNCFTRSEVDLELKKIYAHKPPITNKIVRRKCRKERGSSVPSVDSYYGTKDLAMVGHASYFIPMLTPLERKAIGWKDTYKYGKWKYSRSKLNFNKSISKLSLGNSLSRLLSRNRLGKSSHDDHHRHHRRSHDHPHFPHSKNAHQGLDKRNKYPVGGSGSGSNVNRNGTNCSKTSHGKLLMMNRNRNRSSSTGSSRSSSSSGEISRSDSLKTVTSFTKESQGYGLVRRRKGGVVWRRLITWFVPCVKNPSAVSSILGETLQEDIVKMSSKEQLALNLGTEVGSADVSNNDSLPFNVETVDSAKSNLDAEKTKSDECSTSPINNFVNSNHRDPLHNESNDHHKHHHHHHHHNRHHHHNHNHEHHHSKHGFFSSLLHPHGHGHGHSQGHDDIEEVIGGDLPATDSPRVSSRALNILHESTINPLKASDQGTLPAPDTSALDKPVAFDKLGTEKGPSSERTYISYRDSSLCGPGDEIRLRKIIKSILALEKVSDSFEINSKSTEEASQLYPSSSKMPHQELLQVISPKSTTHKDGQNNTKIASSSISLKPATDPDVQSESTIKSHIKSPTKPEELSSTQATKGSCSSKRKDITTELNKYFADLLTPKKSTVSNNYSTKAEFDCDFMSGTAEELDDQEDDADEDEGTDGEFQYSTMDENDTESELDFEGPNFQEECMVETRFLDPKDLNLARYQDTPREVQFNEGYQYFPPPIPNQNHGGPYSYSSNYKHVVLDSDVDLEGDDGYYFDNTSIDGMPEETQDDNYNNESCNGNNDNCYQSKSNSTSAAMPVNEPSKYYVLWGASSVKIFQKLAEI